MQRFIPIKLDEPKGRVLTEAAYEGEEYATVLEIHIPEDVLSGFITVDFQLLYDGDVFVSEPIMINEVTPDEEVIIGNREARFVRYTIPPMVTRIAGNVPFQFTAHSVPCGYHCSINNHDGNVVYKSVTHLLEVKDSINGKSELKGLISNTPEGEEGTGCPGKEG